MSAATVQWEDVRYDLEAIEDPRIDRFLVEIRKCHVNGGAILGCFVPTDSEMFDQAAEHDLRGTNHRFSTFLKCPSVRSNLPELRITHPLPEEPHFEYTVPLALEGLLAHLLLAGGAYHRFAGTLDEARNLARDFVNAIVGERYLTVIVGATSTPWSTWFHGVAWDLTSVLYDRGARRFWLLAISDTD